MTTSPVHLFFDFDSTIVTKESFDEVINLALTDHPDQQQLMGRIEAITTEGMEGTLAFTDSLERRLAVTPLHRDHFVSVGKQLTEHITEGMHDLFSELNAHGLTPYIISGGFRESILPVAHALGVPDHQVYTNTVTYSFDGAVETIDTNNVCYTNDGKAPVIAHIKQADDLTGPTCMIGDGANDLKAYELGVADHFCAFTGNVHRTVMKERAPAAAASVPELRDFIFSSLIS